jgi:hypothetical protein
MHGFAWVRIDRTADRTAPLKKLARGCGKDEVWALGLLVRTKLVYATRFPEGVADLTAEDLALELDVDDVAVAQLVDQGYLQQLDSGLAFVGWRDDPAVRDLLARRHRATGRMPADERQATGRETAGNRQPTGRQPAGSGQAAGHTEHDRTEQNMTGQDMSDMPQRLGGLAAAQLLPTAHAEVAAIVLDAWPAEKRCNPRQVLVAIRQDSLQPDAHTCRRIAQAAQAWVSAYQQQGRVQFLPRLDNWISSGAWREDPPQDPAPSARRARTRNGDVALTHQDMSAIIQQLQAAEAADHTKGQEDEQFPF